MPTPTQHSNGFIRTTNNSLYLLHTLQGWGTNRNIAWNIRSICQPFLKGKLIARLEAFDLLHQLSNTQYEVNAQGRTETWYRFLPHYVMLHVVYHWTKNPKKKQ